MEFKESPVDALVSTSKTKGFLLAIFDIVLFLLLLLSIQFAFLLLWDLILGDANLGNEHPKMELRLLTQALFLISTFIAAAIVLRIHRLPFVSLGLVFRRQDFLHGMLLIILFYAVAFGISLAVGAVEIASIQFLPSMLLMSFLLFVLVSVTEEVAMRGFALGRLLDAGINKFWALMISSALFSAMHLFNPSFTLVPSINLLVAGFFLGASYVYTRNLTFPIVLHLFWNWLQGPVLGYEVSGTSLGKGLFTLRLPQDNLLNGGAFGFEGSIICTVLTILATWVIIKMFKGSKA